MRICVPYLKYHTELSKSIPPAQKSRTGNRQYVSEPLRATRKLGNLNPQPKMPDEQFFCEKPCLYPKKPHQNMGIRISNRKIHTKV